MIKLEMPKMVHNDDFDIDIKPYLTSQDVEIIANEMMKVNNYTERQFIKDTYILKICVPSEDFKGMDYELLKASGLVNAVENEIENFYEIDHYIYDQEKITTQLNGFLSELLALANKLEKKMPKPKELKTMIDRFQGMKNDK